MIYIKLLLIHRTGIRLRGGSNMGGVLRSGLVKPNRLSLCELSVSIGAFPTPLVPTEFTR